MDIYEYIMYKNVLSNKSDKKTKNNMQQINIQNNNNNNTDTKKIKRIHIENATIRPYYTRWRQHPTRCVQPDRNEHRYTTDQTEIIEI